VILGLIIVVIAFGALFVILFTRGAGGVDDWTLRQIIRLTQTYVVPRMTFERFDFDLPATARLTGVRFTAPDGTEVLSADAMNVSLAQRPVKGQPIRIRDVTITGANLKLIRDDASGGFKGLLPFVKTGAIRQQDAVAPESRLSEVFEIRNLSLVDGAITFDPGGGQPPMQLTGLTLDLDVQPITQNATEPGWYGFSFASGRAPLATMQAAGSLNLDTLLLRLDSANIALNLSDEDSYAVLPPAVQSLLRSLSARGSLMLDVSGEAPMRDPNAATIDASATLRDFFVTFADYQIPIELGEIHAAMADRTVTLDKAIVTTLGGVVQSTEGQASLSTPDAMPAHAAIAIDKLDLQQFLAAGARGDNKTPPKMAGLLSMQVTADANLKQMPESVRGDGWLIVRKGRLLALPLLGDLSGALQDAIALLSGKQVTKAERSLRDKLDATFSFTRKGVKLSAFALATPAIHARGKGRIGYDSSLNLRISAGVVEKLRKELGGIGDILSFVTDSLLGYKVTGTISKPKIEPSPLGM